MSTALEEKEALKVAAHDLWKKASDASYHERKVHWRFSGYELDQFLNFLRDHQLTLEDMGKTQEEIDRTRRVGHLNAARNCWRLCFKNESTVSVAGRLHVMDEHLKAVGATRYDIGLLEDDTEWIEQCPDYEHALMNAGRRPYVHHRWENGRVTYYDYDPVAKIFTERKTERKKA